MKYCLILFFGLFLSLPGFSIELRLNINDIREMEKFVKYCPKIGQKPKEEMASLNSYFKKKRGLAIEPITCGLSNSHSETPMLVISDCKKPRSYCSDLNVKFRENLNKNSEQKYVVDKIIETKFMKTLTGFSATDQKVIWPISNVSKKEDPLPAAK